MRLWERLRGRGGTHSRPNSPEKNRQVQRLSSPLRSSSTGGLSSPGAPSPSSSSSIEKVPKRSVPQTTSKMNNNIQHHEERHAEEFETTTSRRRYLKKGISSEEDEERRAADGEIGCRRRKIEDFEEVLGAEIIDLRRLASMAWNGVPRSKRKIVWMLLLGYLPAEKSKQAQVLEAKRNEFEHALTQYFEQPDSSSRSHREQQTLRQILVDVPRTCPGIPLFTCEPIQELMIKVLYVWSVRHPACGYVQGMNDLLAIFILVFVANELGIYTSSAAKSSSLKKMSKKKYPRRHRSASIDNVWSAALTDDEYSDGTNYDDDSDSDTTASNLILMLESENNSFFTATATTTNSKKNKNTAPPTNMTADDLEYDPSIDALLLQCDGTILSTQTLHQIAADTYWCLAKILDSIYDHYTHQQPGLLRASAQIQNLLRRVDLDLGRHLENQGIQTLQITFRWINCLLTRELPIPAIIRLWDTCIAEDQGFAKFFPYICAAFLCHFSDTLRYMNTENLHLFLTNLPTHEWKHKDVDTLLSEPFILTSLFQDSPSHLAPSSTSLNQDKDDNYNVTDDDERFFLHHHDQAQDNIKHEPTLMTTKLQDKVDDEKKSIVFI